MKKKTDIIWAILLVGIALFGIVRFIFMSDILKNDKNDNQIAETTVETSEVSDEPEVTVSEQPEITVSDDAESSISDDTEASVDENDSSEDGQTETSVSEEGEGKTDDVKKTESKKAKKKRLKKQQQNILKGITINDCDIVFIGDSLFVFGDEDSDSVPDKLGIDYGLTVYDCSKAGMAAGQATNKWVSQYDLAKCFAKRKNTKGEGCDLFNYSLNRYVERDHTGRQLVIILDCCINDYFQHTPMTGKNSFKSGYEDTLLILKEKFPDAMIICMVPNDVWHEEYGYNTNGVGCTYNMYKDTINDIAVDYNVFCYRFDNVDGIDRSNVHDFLEDGTHPNGVGRDRMAKGIIDYINSVLEYVNNQE